MKKSIKKLSILFDLTPYSKSIFSGSGRAILNLLKQISTLDRYNEYSIITFEKLSFANFQFPKNFKFFQIREQKIFGIFAKEIARRRFVKSLMKKKKIDITHFNLDPYNASGGVVSINFLHDVMHLNSRFKKHARMNFRTKMRAYLRCFLSKKSDYLLVNSNYTKSQIQKHLKVDAKKIKLISFGVENKFKIGDVNLNILKKYDISSDYILFLGRYGAQKNELRVLKSYINIFKQKKISSKTCLVMIGETKNLKKSFKTTLKSFKANNKVILIDRISDDELIHLYRGSFLFLFPSFEEGFGFPVLEAMACGSPVITSQVSSLPEVVGNAAILVSPSDQKQIEDSILKLFNDENLRLKLIQKGLKQSSLYTFKRGAEQILELYNYSQEI